MSNTRKVAYNTLVQIISRVITSGIALVVIGYLGHYLGVIGYGQYTLIFVYLALFGVMVDFGFFLLQVREITQHPEKESYVLGNVVGFKLALSVIIFIVAYILALVLYKDNIVHQGVLIGIVSQVALSLLQVPISLFQARLEMERVAIANVLARVLYLALIIWAIHRDFGLLGIIWVTAGVNIFSLIWQWGWALPFASIAPRWDFKYWLKFLKEALPLGVVTVVALIYFKIDTVMLSLVKDSYAVGIYGAPYKVIEVLLSIPTMFMSSVFPVLTQALGVSHDQALRVFRKGFDVLVLMAWPLAVGGLMLGTPIMILVMRSSDFAPSGPVLSILIWATALSFVGSSFNYSVIAAGKQSILVWPYLAGAVFNIILNIIFIPRYSYIGASINTVATELLVVTYVAIITYRYLRFSPNWTVFFKAMASAVVMAGGLWWFHSPNLFINMVVAVLIYGGMILVTRAIPREVFKELLGR